MNRIRRLGVVAVVLTVLAPTAAAQAPSGAPPVPAPADVRATDHPWDDGSRVDLEWSAPADAADRIAGYKVYRSRTFVPAGEEGEKELERLWNEEAKKAVTLARITATKAILGDDWSGTAESLTPEQAQQVRDARAAAAATAEAAYDRGDRAAIDVSPLPEGVKQWKFIELIEPDRTSYTARDLTLGESYRFRLVAVDEDGNESAPADTTATVAPTREPFDGLRLYFFITTLIFCGSVVTFIAIARGGRPLKVRTIAGLEAVDEAVGRATEMGRSVMFIPGTQDINEMQTIAGITVLARVAKTAAEYDAKVEVPTSRSLVMTTARETVQAAFLAAGRPDAYNEDLIYYVTDEQFGYVAYLTGLMVREKPAACFYMGMFYAESLILAETGNAIGAIQIAGTAQPAQLPFFVAACDYTLIGEEFFAASAYLSGSAEELGSLKGQDVGKLLVAIVLLIGVVLATLASATGSDSIKSAVDFLTQTILA
ncbi:MAG: fibronectin type III domain-containing protein [Phycisphaerales bacterium]|nr:fibronectin type III domain-containing protein [Phycisphaerales bacterium]